METEEQKDRRRWRTPPSKPPLQYYIPLTKRQIDLLTEAVDDVLPEWKKYPSLNKKRHELLETANFLAEYVSGKEE
tara:strand:- start:256 stop:483 length:228 start_codon:yes stop_codon:yes gene_type:complete